MSNSGWSTVLDAVKYMNNWLTDLNNIRFEDSLKLDFNFDFGKSQCFRGVINKFQQMEPKVKDI